MRYLEWCTIKNLNLSNSYFLLHFLFNLLFEMFVGLFWLIDSRHINFTCASQNHTYQGDKLAPAKHWLLSPNRTKYFLPPIQRGISSPLLNIGYFLSQKNNYFSSICLHHWKLTEFNKQKTHSFHLIFSMFVLQSQFPFDILCVCSCDSGKIHELS